MDCQKARQVRKRMGAVPFALLIPVVQADQQGVVPRLLDAGECELDAGDVGAIPTLSRPNSRSARLPMPKKSGSPDASRTIRSSPSGEAFANKRDSLCRACRFV